MTFGINPLVDDHYFIGNNFWSDLLFETGQFDFVSTPDVTLTDGWITRMARVRADLDWLEVNR